MVHIKAIHKLPAIRCLTLILAFEGVEPRSEDLPQPQFENEELLHCGDKLKSELETNSMKSWTVRLIGENEYINNLISVNKKMGMSTNPYFQDAQYLEYLSVNPLKNHRCPLDDPFDTYKLLRFTPSKDLIEVTI